MANITTTIDAGKGVVSTPLDSTSQAQLFVTIPTNLRMLQIVTGSVVLRFPVSDGTESNQYLVTDALGNLTFQAMSISTSGTQGSQNINSISNYVIFANAVSSSITLSLPDASSNTGKAFHIKKIDTSANSVVIQPSGSQTIDRETSFVLVDPYTSINLVGYDSLWWVI